MNFGFLQPWNLLWAGLLIGLFALYCFQRKRQRKTVATLFLFDPRQLPPSSGTRFRFDKLPWTFFCEAAALLALVAALAQPFWAGEKEMPPLAFVLDNSFSMRAELQAGESPLARGKELLRQKLREYPNRRVLWILAEASPRLLSDATARESAGNLESWLANAPQSDLIAALSLLRSMQFSGEIVVVSDREIPEFTPEPDTSLYALGTPLPNCALVNTRRFADRLLLEIANYSTLEAHGQLTVQPGNATEQLHLAPGERRKIVSRLPEAALGVPLTATISFPVDALALDNEVTLYDESAAPLRFALDADLPEALIAGVEKLLVSNPNWRLDDQNYELILTAANSAAAAQRLSRVLFHAGAAPDAEGKLSGEALTLHGDSPLLRGVSVGLLQWYAYESTALPGDVLIRRGSTPLVSVVRRADGAVDLHFNADFSRGNLTAQPFFPILFWNLAQFLQQNRPGLTQRNFLPGETIRFRLAPGAAPVLPLRDAESGRLLREVVANRHEAFPGSLPIGRFALDGNGETFEFSVLPTVPEESDLGLAQDETLEATEPFGASTSQPEWTRGIFYALFIALALVVLEQLLLGKNSRQGGEK